MQLLVITIIGLLLRLIGINKAEGLWNDEYVSWMIASKPFADGFLTGIKSQCHMPFYYFYLKASMAWGGSSDLFLRITSVIPGILSIIVMYFVGLQKDKRTAIIAASFTAISSFLIYYSQEVRLYSLLFLFSALSLWYFLKCLKARTLTNLSGLILFDFLIMFTHTIGFVFVALQLLAFSFLVFKKNKKTVFLLWTGIISLGAILLPFINHIFSVRSFAQWWGSFSLSKIVFLFTDYFSPVLTNLVNAPSNIFYVHSVSFILFTYVTTVISVYLIVKSCIRNKENTVLLILALSFISILAAAAIAGKLVFITKYSIEIYPILIFLFACGLSDVEHKAVRYILFGIILVINLFYLIFSPMSAPKIPRLQGHKIVADLINKAEPSEGDVILFEYYPSDRFTKYIDLSPYTVYSFNKGDFYRYFKYKSNYQEAYSNGKSDYREIFLGKPNIFLNHMLKFYVLRDVKPGHNLFLIINNSVAVYPKERIKQIAENDYLYNKVPLLYLVFSYLKEYTIDYCDQRLRMTKVERAGDWTLIKFTYLNKK